MKYEVVILPSAWEELKGIQDWYLAKFGRQTASNVVDHILTAIEHLGDFPDIGSRTPDQWLNERGYRMVICEKHVAIYRRIEEKIYIYHIADTRTDYVKLFR